MPDKVRSIRRRGGAGIPFLVMLGLLAAIALFRFETLMAQTAAGASATGSAQVAVHMEAVERARRHGLATARTPAERDLVQADLDFAADAQRRHVSEAFRDRFAPDGVLIGPDEPVAFGRDAAYASMQRSRASWHWAPIGVRVNGDLGATWGVAAILYRNAAGEQASVQTRYVTVWERRDGRWQMWVDTGNSGPGPLMPNP